MPGPARNLYNAIVPTTSNVRECATPSYCVKCRAKSPGEIYIHFLVVLSRNGESKRFAYRRKSNVRVIQDYGAKVDSLATGTTNTESATTVE